MDEIVAQATWLEHDWYAMAVDWIHDQIDRRSLYLSGEIEPMRVRPWSVVLRVPTHQGACFFKVTAPYLAREPALVQALACWRPDVVPELLGVNLARNWMLMADAGPLLRGIILSDRDLGHWERVLPLYAGLQQDLAPHVDALVALGAIDRRLSRIPELYAELLRDTRSLRVGEQGGLSDSDHIFLLDQKLALRQLCDELVAYGVHESLDHNDFHDGNITLRNGTYKLFDWGDACVTHPFFSIIIVPRYVSNRLGLDENDPRIVAMQEHYVNAWQAFESRDKLRRIFELARCVGTICRALTWQQVVVHLPPGYALQYAEGISSWLQEFSDEMKRGHL